MSNKNKIKRNHENRRQTEEIETAYKALYSCVLVVVHFSACLSSASSLATFVIQLIEAVRVASHRDNRLTVASLGLCT